MSHAPRAQDWAFAPTIAQASSARYPVLGPRRRQQKGARGLEAQKKKERKRKERASTRGVWVHNFEKQKWLWKRVGSVCCNSQSGARGASHLRTPLVLVGQDCPPHPIRFSPQLRMEYIWTAAVIAIARHQQGTLPCACASRSHSLVTPATAPCLLL